MTCTALVNPQAGEVLWCAIQMSVGSEALAAIMMFCIFLYAVHSFKLPYQVFTPIGLLLLFVFAGAGIASPIGGISAFTTIMWIVVALAGAIIALFFWGLKRE